MNYNELCKAVAGLHGGIEVVMVLSRGKLAASYLKSGGPALDDEELPKVISQIETILRTTRANEDKFGELGFVTIRYKYIDGLFFPIKDSDALVAGVVQPYDHDTLSSKISAMLAQKK